MPRYIDADVLKWRYIPLTIQPEEFVTKSDVENAPTADVRENVHARWSIEPGVGKYCTNCGFDIGNDFDELIEYVNFCPNCGAEMEDKP